MRIPNGMTETDLLCMAPHPDPRVQRPHGALVVTVPFAARWTGRVFPRGERRPRRTGHIYVRCPHRKCGALTEYEIVTGDGP